MLKEWVRVYKSVHTWTGIIAGMALFIAFYAGALTVFKTPLSRWASPPAEMIALTPLAQTQNLIDQTLTLHPEVSEGFFVQLKNTENTPARLHWESRPEGADEHDQLRLEHYGVALDPNGQAQISEIRPSQLAEFIDVLHRVVGLPFDTEYYRWIMGIIAGLYALALLSGLIILLPTLVKDLFALRLGKNLKRMWLDLHNAVGLVSLPFHLIIALTAVGFAFHDGIYAVQNYTVHNGTLGQAFRSGLPAPDPRLKSPADMLPPTELVTKVTALAPDFEPHLLQYSDITGPRPMVRVWGDDPKGMGARAWGSFAVLNPYTGEVINTDYLPSQQAGSFTAINTIFSLHFATFGGSLQKWVYFFLALAGAWLFYSGNILWIESRRRKQRKQQSTPQQRRDTQFLANATIGVSLGCICGISLTIVMAKWLFNWVDDMTAWHQGVYYGTFFLAIAWSFRVGAARAAVHLSGLAALFTAAIPVTSLIAWLTPSLGMWSHDSIATLGVDITALSAAIAFVWMSLKTRARVQKGDPDSVWSLAQCHFHTATSTIPLTATHQPPGKL